MTSVSIPDLVNTFCPEKSFDYTAMSIGGTKKKIDLNVPISKETMLDFFKKRGEEAKVALTDTSLPVASLLTQDGRKAKVLASEIEENFVKFVNGLYKDKQVLSLQEFIDIKKEVRAEVNAFEVRLGLISSTHWVSKTTATFRLMILAKSWSHTHRPTCRARTFPTFSSWSLEG